MAAGSAASACASMPMVSAHRLGNVYIACASNLARLGRLAVKGEKYGPAHDDGVGRVIAHYAFAHL